MDYLVKTLLDRKKIIFLPLQRFQHGLNLWEAQINIPIGHSQERIRAKFLSTNFQIFHSVNTETTWLLCIDAFDQVFLGF